MLFKFLKLKKFNQFNTVKKFEEILWNSKNIDWYTTFNNCYNKVQSESEVIQVVYISDMKFCELV